jgi:Predicted Zn peptidase
MKRLQQSIVDSLARKFRLDNGISLTEAINIKSLLRKLNILTVFRPLSEEFCGMSLLSHNGSKFILINSNNAKGRQHFTIAHELYHLFIDKNPAPHICQSIDEGKDIAEINANMFAASLLMPEDGLFEFISQEEIKSKSINLSTIIKIEQYFSVSRSALLFRLKDCKIITKLELDKLLKYPVKNTAKLYGYDTALYEKGNEGLVLGDFGEKARLLYEKDVISEGHYRELLNLIADEKDEDSFGC